MSVVLSASKFLNIEVLQGGSLADKLGGSSLADTVLGSNGADSLWGAAGKDFLVGGGGADSYWFSIGDGADTIADEGSDNKSDVVNFYNLKFSQLAFSRPDTGEDLSITAGASQGIYRQPDSGKLGLLYGIYRQQQRQPRQQIHHRTTSHSVWRSALPVQTA